jgi:hypothetical protein
VAVRTGGVKARRWLPAAGIGIALAIGAVLGAGAVADAAAHERRIGLERAAASLSARVETILERGIVEMELLAGGGLGAASFRSDALPRLGAIDGLDAIAMAQIDDGELLVRAVVPQDVGFLGVGTDLALHDEVAPVIGRAIDEADATAGSPFVLDGREVIVVGAPTRARRSAAPRWVGSSSGCSMPTPCSDPDGRGAACWCHPVVAPRATSTPRATCWTGRSTSAVGRGPSVSTTTAPGGPPARGWCSPAVS